MSKKEEKKKYPNNLKQIMDDNGISQSSLVKMGNISTTTLGNLYNQKEPGSAKMQGTVVTAIKKYCKTNDIELDSYSRKAFFPHGTKNNWSL